MSVLGAIGVFFGILALAFIGLYLWLRAKVRGGLAWLLVETLDQALQAMKKKQGEPDYKPDAELDGLVEEAEKALPLAKEALEKRQHKNVANITGPILKKIGERVERLDQERKAQEEKAALEPAPLALEAPDKSSDGAQSKAAEEKKDDKPAQQ